ncbi:upstream-binding factor 1-like protein 1 [Aulostomus maculatus]
METEISAWNKEKLLTLLAAMKTNICDQDMMKVYYRGMNKLDWARVAFPPYSPEACQEMWRRILQNINRTRTLTELIVEAEGKVIQLCQDQTVLSGSPKTRPTLQGAFFEANLAEFQKKHPGMKKHDLEKLIIAKFKSLPPEEKEKYKEKHKLALKEYKRKTSVLREQCGDDACGELKKPKRKKDSPFEESSEESEKDSLPPKPPGTGYHLFCREQKVTGGGRMRSWGTRWRGLTETQRNGYKMRCQELKIQHANDVRNYLLTLNKDKKKQLVNEKRLQRFKPLREEVIPFPGEPIVPPRSGNNLYLKEQMKLRPNSQKVSEYFRETCQMWRKLTSGQKAVYIERVKEMKHEYKQELQNWFETLTRAEQENYRRCKPTRLHFLSVSQRHDPGDDADDTEMSSKPSDSEDEEMEYSSSEEEVEPFSDSDEEEDEEDTGGIMFDIY